MKRTLSLILVAMMCVSMLTGCCLSHEWVEADCTNPRYCAKCDKTDGEALGHDVVEADCLNPSYCTRCGMTEGEALGHDWAEADCKNHIILGLWYITHFLQTFTQAFSE